MSTVVATTGFSQEAFENFLSTRDEPAWLLEQRRKAWQRFVELPMEYAVEMNRLIELQMEGSVG
jgi:hypothetical protein